jgi:nucleoside-diphosphate-sugar epimerase
MSNVVVTGAGGYIGTQIVRDLLKEGHQVLGIDRFFFGIETLAKFKGNSNLKLLKKDIRDITVDDLKGYELVFDLACLSNDPAGEIDPRLTIQINRDGRLHVAKTSKASGIKHYIISSSCSVYGQADSTKLTELSKVNPISVYAKSTLDAEEASLEIADENFSVTALRNATVFGLSSRMRFDLVVNLMTLTAFQKKRIIVLGGGQQWRPLVHVSDVSNAFLKVMNSPKKLVNKEIFNIGLDNFQIVNLSYLIRETLPFDIEIEVAPDDADTRDYNVDFSKSEKIIGFKAKTSITDGIREIYSALKIGSVETGPRTVTVQWYKNILEAKNLVDSISLNGRIL